MSFNTIGDAVKAAKSREVSPAFSEVAIFKQLIKERVDAGSPGIPTLEPPELHLFQVFSRRSLCD